MLNEARVRRSSLKSKRFIKKRYFILIIALLLLTYFSPSMFGGYSLSESLAIHHSFPNMKGEVVFEKEFGNKKAVVSIVEEQKYVKIIENKYGFFYGVIDASEIIGATPDGKMKATWSATQRGETVYYDTLFAAEVFDDEIVRVVVSNDRRNEEYKNRTLNEVEEKSHLFIEMDVVNGFAVNYSYLPSSDVGHLVFRGINSEGEIVSIF